MNNTLNKWAAGVAYGPVLSQTDLYLLQPDIEINPILAGGSENQLQFHLVTGYANPGRPNADGNFVGKDEPATLPRVSQLIVISRVTPWCTIVKKDTGVTIGDICTAIFKEYTENNITEAEYNSLNGRFQEQLKRTAAMNMQLQQPQNQWGYYQQAAPERLRRVDWLRERVHFEGLLKDDNYVKSRLGFKAPNVFVMELVG